MMGFLGGRKIKSGDEAHGQTAPSHAVMPTLAPPPLPPVHTIPPPMMRGEARAPAMPPPLPSAMPPLSIPPLSIPMHPRDLVPPPRPAAPTHPATHIGFSEPPSAPPTAAEIVANHAGTPSNYELMRLLFDTREALSEELAIGSKEYQVLRSLKSSDLDVCQDLVTELTRRLEGNSLYQSLGKLNEAYALALRYRRPAAT